MPLTSKKKIFNALRTEYRGGNNYTSPVFDFLKNTDTNLEKSFEGRITGLNGKFFRCNSITEFHYKFRQLLSQLNYNSIFSIEENIRNLLPPDLHVTNQFSENCDISVTGCEFLIAQTGSVVVTTNQTGSRKIISFPTTHIVVAKKGQLIDKLSDAIALLSEKYNNNFPSQLTVITGPSRTADIEKTLVMGAHGPKDVIIFYLDA
jgi:L-lactate dehydrogenase complex protein LldG